MEAQEISTKNLKITNIWIKFASVCAGYLLLRWVGFLVVMGACWYPQKGLNTFFCNGVNVIDAFILPVFLIGNIIYSLVYLSKKGIPSHFPQSESKMLSFSYFK